MRITIEPTEHVVELDGVRCRHWNGVSDKGVKCLVLVHRIAVHESEDATEFEAVLRRELPPTQPVSLRQIV